MGIPQIWAEDLLLFSNKGQRVALANQAAVRCGERTNERQRKARRASLRDVSSFVKRKAGINIIVPSMLVIFAALCVHQFNLLSREATLSSRQLSFIEDSFLVDGRYKDAGTLKVIYLRERDAYVGWFNDNISKLNPVAYPWITTAVLRDLVPPSVMSNFEIVDCQSDQQCKAQPHGNKRMVLVAYADSLVYPLSPDSVVIHLDSLGAAEKGHHANLL